MLPIPIQDIHIDDSSIKMTIDESNEETEDITKIILSKRKDIITFVNIITALQFKASNSSFGLFT